MTRERHVHWHQAARHALIALSVSFCVPAAARDLPFSNAADDAPPSTPPATEPASGEAPPTEASGPDNKTPAEVATKATAKGPRVEDTETLAAHRAPVSALQEHFLGSASRAVRFDWRRSPVELAAMGGELLERNNFGSHRLGVIARKAFGDLIGELALNYVFATSTPSSDILALTPYRQSGRPSHLELDLNVGMAVVEGVVTPLVDLLPPAEMALVVVAGVRYLGYPETWLNRQPLDLGTELVSPQLSTAERARIEPNALPGMLVDAARFHTLVGVAWDSYFQPGLFFSPRALVAVPVLAPLTATSLGLWWELSLAIGYAL